MIMMIQRKLIIILTDDILVCLQKLEDFHVFRRKKDILEVDESTPLLHDSSSYESKDKDHESKKKPKRPLTPKGAPDSFAIKVGLITPSRNKLILIFLENSI